MHTPVVFEKDQTIRNTAVFPFPFSYILLLILNFMKFSVTDIPKLTDPGFPLNVSSSSDSIMILQTVPAEIPLTAYVSTISCVLLCNILLPYPSNMPTNSSSTSLTFASLLPWSQCNITLSYPCKSTSSETLMLAATTIFASKYSVGGCVHVFMCVCILWYFSKTGDTG